MKVKELIAWFLKKYDFESVEAMKASNETTAVLVNALEAKGQESKVFPANIASFQQQMRLAQRKEGESTSWGDPMSCTNYDGSPP